MNLTPNLNLTRCLTYLETQLVSPGNRRFVTRSPTITVSRMTGSGGLAIADHLAGILQGSRPGEPAPWTVFHRSLIEKVLADDHLPSDFSRFVPENRVSYITDTLEELFGLHPSASSMVTQIAKTILSLGELGNCILVGRGSHIVLGKCDTAFHVRLVGSLDRRIQRVAETQNLDANVAREYIKTEDAARRRYLKTYFDTDIDDPLKYHLTLNTDTFAIREAAELIAAAVLGRFPKNPE